MSHRKNTLIKICGVKTPELVSRIVELGADMIGLVFHPPSKRYVSPEQARLISQACHKAGIISVGIFVNHTARQIQEIIDISEITMIELQGAIAKQQHHFLPVKYPRIYAQSVSSNGQIIDDIDGGLEHCDSQRDYLLFDNNEGGTGKTFNWEGFDYKGPFRSGLAGGLNPENVTAAIKKFRPQLLSTSTGVENSTGNKDLGLIEKFISRIREYSYEN